MRLYKSKYVVKTKNKKNDHGIKDDVKPVQSREQIVPLPSISAVYLFNYFQFSTFTL